MGVCCLKAWLRVCTGQREVSHVSTGIFRLSSLVRPCSGAQNYLHSIAESTVRGGRRQRPGDATGARHRVWPLKAAAALPPKGCEKLLLSTALLGIRRQKNVLSSTLDECASRDVRMRWSPHVRSADRGFDTISRNPSRGHRWGSSRGPTTKSPASPPSGSLAALMSLLRHPCCLQAPNLRPAVPGHTRHTPPPPPALAGRLQPQGRARQRGAHLCCRTSRGAVRRRAGVNC